MDQFRFGVFQRWAGGARAKWQVVRATRAETVAGSGCGSRHTCIAGASWPASTAAPRPWPITQVEQVSASRKCLSPSACALAMPCDASINSSRASRRPRLNWKEDKIIARVSIAVPTRLFNVRSASRASVFMPIRIHRRPRHRGQQRSPGAINQGFGVIQVQTAVSHCPNAAPTKRPPPSLRSWT
jgi:hypothetical protein